MSGFDMRYLIVFLFSLSIFGCGESQYERCLRVEKEKVDENWEDIYEIAQHLVPSFGFPLDFYGVLDGAAPTQLDIQRLRYVLKMLADLPLAEIEKRQLEIMVLGADNIGVENSVLTETFFADYQEVEEAWDRFFHLVDDSLTEEYSDFIYEDLHEKEDSYNETIDNYNDVYFYTGAPDQMMLATAYESINKVEKLAEKYWGKLDLVQNEIASNICNSRGLY